MYCEENYMTYIEDGEECCGSFMLKLRKKRHTIVISSLLILAIISIVSGLYNGLTVKKYSDLSIVVGILFPSIILVFVCVYLAFICGREPFRRSVLSRHLPNGNHSQNSQVASQYPQPNSASRKELRVRYQPKFSTESRNGLMATRNQEPHCNKVFYTTDDSTDYCEAKISRRHLRSFSNSDVSKQMHRNYDMFFKKPEICKVNCKRTDDNQYSPRLGRHEDVTQRKKFKRSVSDTANKNRNRKSSNDKSIWNSQSLKNLRRHVDKLNSEAMEQNDSNLSNEVIKNPSDTSYLLKNYKTTEEHAIATRCKEYDDGVQRYSNRQAEYVDTSSQEDVRKKGCYTKSEIYLYSSNVLKLPYEYKQSFHFSNLPPGRKENKDTEDTANCSSEDEKIGSSFKSNRPEMKMNKEKIKSSSSEQDTYRLRRKTMYFPSTNSEESTRSSRGYAHEFCSYPKTDNKLTQRPLSRKEENFEDYQNDKQVQYYWQ